MNQGRKGTRRRIILSAIAATLAGLSPTTRASVEFSGPSHGGAGDVIDFGFTLAYAFDLLVGTYANNSGNAPSGDAYSNTGIDSVLTLLNGSGAQVATSDDLIGPNTTDSEIRTISYPGRTGATLLPVLVPGFNYTARLARYGSTANGNWSIALDSLSGINVERIVPNSLTTISTALVYGNDSQLSLNTTLTTNTLDVRSGGRVVHNNGASLVTNFLGVLSGSGRADYQLRGGTLSVSQDCSISTQFTQSGGEATINRLLLGDNSTSGLSARYRLTGGTLTLNQANVFNVSFSDFTNYFELQGGTLVIPSAAALASTVSSYYALSWTGGTARITESGSAVGLGVFTYLSKQRALELPNATGLSTASSPIELLGGRLAVPYNFTSMNRVNWTSGTLEFTGGETQITDAGPLGKNVLVNGSRTLRTASYLYLASDANVAVQTGGRIESLGGIRNDGILTLDGIGSLIDTPSIDNRGTISGNAYLAAASTTNQLTGQINLPSGKELSFGGTLYNNARINLTGGSLITTAGLSNGTLGTMTGRGLVRAPSFFNSGRATFSAGISDLDTSVVNDANGKIIVTGAGNLTVYGPVTNNVGSEFRVSSDAKVAFLSPVTGLAAFTGSGTKYFESTASGGALFRGDGATVVEPSGQLSTAGIRDSSLIVRGSVQIAENSPTSKLNVLAIDGGQLDLTNNSLVLDYTGTSPRSYIRDAIVNGDLIATTASPAGKAIASAEASSLGVNTWGGLSVDSTSLLVRLTFQGDANIDGAVDTTDFNRLISGFGNVSPTWDRGDFNYDNTVSSVDFAMLVANFGAVLPAAPAALPGELDAGNQPGATVPEPALAGMLAAVSLLSIRRRQQR